MLKVKTHNQIASPGLDRLVRDRYEVGTEIADPDALLLRSYKLPVAELTPRLRAVARSESVFLAPAPTHVIMRNGV